MENIIKLIDSMKRLIISTMVLIFAWMATSSATIPSEYGGIWIGFAGTVIAFYLGSKTATQNMESK
jgi:hypothetical protein